MTNINLKNREGGKQIKPQGHNKKELRAQQNDSRMNSCFCHISKDETAKGVPQSSVLVPHFSFTHIRSPQPPFPHCADVVPTLQQFFLLSFGSWFCSWRVCSFPRSPCSLFSCDACLLLLRTGWRSNPAHVRSSLAQKLN